MKVSLHWLQDYIALSCSPDEMLERLTMGGTEVEGRQTVGVEDKNVVVAEVVSFVPHPNADRLRLCQVSVGTETRQIVCGARNFEVGSRVPLALPGAELPGGFKIKESKLRGELSQGMMCSAKELGFDGEAEGLLILPASTPVGKRLSEVIPADLLFDLEVTPNRPDLLSYRGLARELAALGCGTVKVRDNPAIAWPTDSSAWAVELLDPVSAPYYSATLLVELQVGPSPAWLQEKIRATGHRPINNVVDITNLVLWETGQPLHAFDLDRLSGSALQVRSAVTGEKVLALNEQLYELQAGDLVIADAAGVRAIAGVMGGKASGVSETTRRVLLESAWFLPTRVRATAKRLGLSSDSSYRFERRVDPAGVLAGRNRAIQLLQELTGAKIPSAPLERGELPTSRGPITLRPSRVRQVLGIEVSETETARVLQALGLKAEREQWIPPSFRYDLEGEIDLIEELARVRGLQSIPSRLLSGWVPPSTTDRSYDRSQALRHYLAARGWQECLTEALIEGRLVSGPAALEIRNPINAQYTHLRPNLRGSLLAAAAYNLAQGNGRLRLFEYGRCYGEKAGQVVESQRLGLIVTGTAQDLHWSENERSLDLFDLPSLESEYGLPASARLFSGPVDPAELKLHGLKTRVFYAEYDLQDWIQHNPPASIYRPLPAFPVIRRDVALVLDRQVTHAAVLEAIEKSRPAQLESVRLFDVFADDKGEKLPREKKSHAYALTYRAFDRTLTDKEVNAWHEQLLAKLKGELGCELRAA